MPWLPRSTFLEWPEAARDLPVSEIQKLYESGFAGAKPTSDEARAEFHRLNHWPDGDRVTSQFGMADNGAGKLVIPFIHVLEMFPGCWPGKAGQARGDCVSWSTRNAALFTMVCDIVSGLPDEKTGLPEEPPDVPPAGIADGVLSTETFYWYRGYDGDGWMCGDAANVAVKTSGLMVRKPYPELNIDLTSYSGSLAGKYGRTKPPTIIQSEGAKRLIHQATDCSPESARDLTFNGYGVTTCGGEGFSDQRDENGVSGRQGSWAHAYVQIGSDERDITIQRYGQPLELWLNSWAKWNRGPRDIMSSAGMVPPDKKELWTRLGIVNAATGNIMIPEGAWWAKRSDSKNRERIAFSGVNGWPKKKLPEPWIF